MSVSQTSPVAPARWANALARSPVPPAMSSTFMPGRTFAWRTVNAFHTRCRPTDITSFITSYFDATESNTPATRCAFSDSSTCANPK